MAESEAKFCDLTPVLEVFMKDMQDNVKAIKSFYQNFPNPVCILKGMVADFVNNSMLTDLLESPLGDMYQGFLEGNLRGAAEGVLGVSFDDIGDIASEAMLGFCQELLATFLMMYDDLALYFIQLLGKEVIRQNDLKRTQVKKLKEALRQLHNALVINFSGTPYFNKYLADLKKALVHLDTARMDLEQVKSVLFAIGQFNKLTFQHAKDELKAADEHISPQKRTGERRFVKDYTGFISSQDPLVALVAGNQSSSSPIHNPTSDEQRAALLTIPRLCKDVIQQMTAYLQLVTSVNTVIVLYEGSVQLLSQAGLMLGTLEKFSLQILNGATFQLEELIKDMQSTLNSPKATTTYLPTVAFSWMARVKAVRGILETIPAGALESRTADRQALQLYKNSVIALKKLNDMTDFGLAAQLKATAAVEQVGQLEVQVTKVIASANTALITRANKNNILQNAKSAVDYCSLVLLRCDQIDAAIKPFTNYEFAMKGTFGGILKTLLGFFNKTGFDKLAKALLIGDLSALFNKDIMKAMSLGSAILQLLCMEDLLLLGGGLLSQRECLATLRRQMNDRKKVNRIRWKPPLMEGCNASLGPLNLKLTLAFKNITKAKACASGVFDALKVPGLNFEVSSNKIAGGQYGSYDDELSKATYTPQTKF